MAETTGLLNRRTGNTVPRVRIPPSPLYTATGYSAVRLAHLLWEQGVVGSNPTTPTTQKPFTKVRVFLFHAAEAKTCFQAEKIKQKN